MNQTKSTDKEQNIREVLYIIIPAYNEEANINQCIDDWYPIVESHSGGGKNKRLTGDYSPSRNARRSST